MTLLETLVHTPLANAFGWAIVHSLWQGAIAAVIVTVTLFITRSARVRYAVALLALLGTFVAFCVTLSFSVHAPRAIPMTVIDHLTAALSDTTPSAQIRIERRLADLLPWITPFWIAGMCLFHLHSLLSWTVAHRLRTNGVCAAPDGWQQRLDDLRDRLRITKPVVLLETALAQSPAVIGYLRPVILAPVGMLTGMPVNQVESILVHELAHIRRHDYLANVLQIIVEGFLFYHPAVWWISHVIRSERENCCDDFVVEVSGDVRDYAEALTVLEENRWAASQPALAANGGALMKRIHRLLYPKESPRSFVTPALSAAVLTVVVALALPAWQQAQSGPYDRWLNDDVPYIITASERAAFQALTTNEEREKFIEQFWLRRDPTPGTAENEFKEEHYRRIAYANDHFFGQSGLPGQKTDRGRIYITFGPPDELDSHPNGSAAMPPYENWRYRYLEGIGTNVTMSFVDTERNGEFRMAKDPVRPDRILYDQAMKEIEQGEYEGARLALNTLINNYDTSEYLVKAKMAIADSWFRQGDAHGLAQAEAEYRDFIQFYPNTQEAVESRVRVCAIQKQAGETADECRTTVPQMNGDVPLIQ